MKTQGEGLAEKKSNADVEREAFHRQQVEYPGILMFDLDPDKPILLGELQHFDELICIRLRMLGYPGTGNGDKSPKPCRPLSLAKKLTSGSADISPNQIGVLAARIGWLQRNRFRWGARDGYAAYFLTKATSPKLDHSSDHTSQNVAKGSPAEELVDAVSCKSEDTNVSPDGVFSSIDKLDRHPRQTARADFNEELISGGDTEPDGSFVSEVAPSSAGAGQQASDWTNWAAEIRRRRPAKTPQMPDRPNTYALGFPIKKAKNFLYAAAKQNPLIELIEIAKILLDDRPELYRALAHDEQARDDLLDAFAKLGLDIDV